MLTSEINAILRMTPPELIAHISTLTSIEGQNLARSVAKLLTAPNLAYLQPEEVNIAIQLLQEYPHSTALDAIRAVLSEALISTPTIHAALEASERLTFAGFDTTSTIQIFRTILPHPIPGALAGPWIALLLQSPTETALDIASGVITHPDDPLLWHRLASHPSANADAALEILQQRIANTSNVADKILEVIGHRKDRKSAQRIEAMIAGLTRLTDDDVEELIRLRSFGLLKSALLQELISTAGYRPLLEKLPSTNEAPRQQRAHLKKVLEIVRALV